MRLGSLTFIITALFLVSACETMDDKGGGDASGLKAKTYGGKLTPKGFSVAPGTARDFIVNVGDRVFFALDKSSLSSGSRSMLEKQIAWLKKYGGVKVVVEGHCDERGTREYNLALGERRANAVKDFLVAMGISPNRVKVISYGKERPAALGHNEASWKQNRRAVTLIAGK